MPQQLVRFAMILPRNLRNLWRWVFIALEPRYDSLPLSELSLTDGTESNIQPTRQISDDGASWQRIFWSTVPFCISKPLNKTSRTLPRPSSTTYLNGLRGVACI